MTVVVVGTFLAVVLYYLIKILQDVRDVTTRARQASEELKGDLDELRENIKEDGGRLRDVAVFFLERTGILKKRRGKRPPVS